MPQQRSIKVRARASKTRASKTRASKTRASKTRASKTRASKIGPQHGLEPHPSTFLYINRDLCAPDRPSLDKYRDIVFKGKILQYCDELPLKQIKTIIGPMSFTEYRFGDRNISIFGEAHNFIGLDECVRVSSLATTIMFQNFLNMIIRYNPDKFYDFYFEQYYLPKALSERRVRLGAGMTSFIDVLFGRCLEYVKEGCEYPNLRAHYVDIRKELEDFEFIRDLLVSDKTTCPYPTAINILEKIEDYLLTSRLLIKKELKKSYYGLEIFNFIVEKFNSLKKYIENTYTDVNSEYLLTVANLIMDAYTLGRMFRRFKEGGNKPSEITNIIVYAGDGHSGIYREFIEEILIKKLGVGIVKVAEEHNTEGNCCIDICEETRRNSSLFIQSRVPSY